MAVPENVWKTIGQARDAITVKRVYGDPYEREGVTVVPAAAVRGGGGGGGGSDAEGAGGAGTGFGVMARPAGAFVIKDGRVRWEPVVDVTRIVLGFQVVLVTAILAWRSVTRARAARSGA
jgi:uncharacterized spore protein YtfJ